MTTPRRTREIHGEEEIGVCGGCGAELIPAPRNCPHCGHRTQSAIAITVRVVDITPAMHCPADAANLAVLCLRCWTKAGV